MQRDRQAGIGGIPCNNVVSGDYFACAPCHYGSEQIVPPRCHMPRPGWLSRVFSHDTLTPYYSNWVVQRDDFNPC